MLFSFTFPLPLPVLHVSVKTLDKLLQKQCSNYMYMYTV